MPTDSSRSANRSERILALMAMSLIGMSILAILAIVIGTGVGVGADDGFSRGVWPIIIVLPIPGLALGLVLIIALLTVSWGRRGRENRTDNRGGVR